MAEAILCRRGGGEKPLGKPDVLGHTPNILQHSTWTITGFGFMPRYMTFVNQTDNNARHFYAFATKDGGLYSIHEDYPDETEWVTITFTNDGAVITTTNKTIATSYYAAWK